MQVAFGDTAMVREWLAVRGEVGKPSVEHPSRPIQGLACSRTEISGSHFWGLFKALCGTPEAFFENSYVHNYCPLCFMNKTGKNITPPMLKAAEKAQLQAICDLALLEVVRLLGVEWVVGVGKYGADRAAAALRGNCALCSASAGKRSSPCCGKKKGGGVESFTLHAEVQGGGERGGQGGGKEEQGGGRQVYVCSIMHPSPINPAARTGWAELVTTQLTELGILDIITAAL